MQFWGLGTLPQIGGRDEARGRVWYHVKAHYNAHNLSIETETLSLSIYEPIALQVLLGETVPEFGGGG